jgi:electron transfer flavoprotein beta subunit
MKVLVTVKEVAELEEEFEVESGTIPDRYLSYDLNEWDDYAIEEAVRTGERLGGVEVVAVTIGPARTEETIRIALAKGVDRAVRVWDDALEDATYVDVETRTSLLSKIVERESPDLVFTGVQSGDQANAATGVALAAKVDFAWAAVVNDLDLRVDDGEASIRRELEGGVEELTDVELPAVLTIQSGINEPRYASLRGMQQAQRKPMEVLTFEDVGLDESLVESPIERITTYEPESEADTQIWEGSSEETAHALAEFLRDEGVVEA